MKSFVRPFLIVAIAFMASSCGDEQAWIVLEFKLKNGGPAEMAFNNPSSPDITLSECKAALDQASANLIDAAVKRAPILRSATFVSAKCVMSVDDPIKPKS